MLGPERALTQAPISGLALLTHPEFSLPQYWFVQMYPATQSIAPDVDIRSSLTGLFNVLSLFEKATPASHVKGLVAVAKDEGRCVGDYARMCGLSHGQMSRILIDLGDIYSRDRNLPGLGLLESRPDPLDRRYLVVKLSPKGKALIGQIVRALEYGSATLR